MNNNPKFSNIKSKDIMKEILSFLSMCKILKLIKYNKNLQNRLDISKNVFETFSESLKLNFIEYKGKKVLYGFDKDTKKYNLIRYNISIIGNTFCYCIYLIYLLTYAILLVTRATFEENYASKDFYNYNIINKINN